jgi:UDP-2,3-diacylglucosamine pyrophosphatase LpxH
MIELIIKEKSRNVLWINLSYTYNRIAVVSDLHAEDKGFNARCFTKTIKAINPEVLIIAGDVFNNMEKQKFDESMAKIVVELTGYPNNLREILITLSIGNHDPKIKGLMESFNINNINVKAINGVALLRFNDKHLVVLHGDLLFKNGIIAAFINLLLGKGFYERITKRILLLNSDTFLIMGHTHIPFIDYKMKSANSGSWAWRPIVGKSSTILIINKDFVIKLLKPFCKV